MPPQDRISYLFVVPDVFEDGPEPMGPMVYLRAGSREVGAVTCRCMPSRVREIRETLDYDLLPLDALGDIEPTPTWLPPDGNSSRTPDAREREGGSSLENALRWPRSF